MTTAAAPSSIWSPPAGGSTHIPAQRRVKIQRSVSPNLYRQRNLVECFFCKLKQFRRIATRFDKLARNFLTAVALASTRIWLCAIESTAKSDRLDALIAHVIIYSITLAVGAGVIFGVAKPGALVSFVIANALLHMAVDFTTSRIAAHFWQRTMARIFYCPWR